DRVVEVVRLEVPQTALLVQGGEQLADRLEVGIHRAADVHQEEEPHVVAPRRAEDQLDLAGVAAGPVGGVVVAGLPVGSPPGGPGGGEGGGGGGRGGGGGGDAGARGAPSAEGGRARARGRGCGGDGSRRDRMGSGPRCPPSDRLRRAARSARPGSRRTSASARRSTGARARRAARG